MNTKIYISLMAIAGLVTASCSSEDVKQPAGSNDVKLSACISNIKSRANAEGDGGSFSAGDRIVLTNLTNGTTGTYITADGSGAFTAESESVVTWAPSVKNDFRAYSPVDATFESFAIPADQSTVEGIRSADWLTADVAGLVRPADASLAIEMEHRMAKVTVQIAAYSQYFDDMDVASFTPTAVSLNSPSASAGETAEYTLHTISPYVVVDATAGKHSFAALIAPEAFKAGDLFMSFTLEGQIYNVMVNEDLCTDGFLQGGKNYCFDLTVDGKTNVSIANVSVLDWEQGEVVDNLGGNLTTAYQPATIALDPADPTHAIIQASSTGTFGDYEHPDEYTWYNLTWLSTDISKLTIKGLNKDCYQDIHELYFSVEGVAIEHVVIEDVENISLFSAGTQLDGDITFTDVVKLSIRGMVFVGRWHIYNGTTAGMTYSSAGEYDSSTWTYQSYVVSACKFMKPLEIVTNYLINMDAVELHNAPHNGNVSTSTLYLSADQKKMELTNSIDIEDSIYGMTKYVTYTATTENFWQSGVTELENAEFAGVIYKKIIKIQ